MIFRLFALIVLLVLVKGALGAEELDNSVEETTQKKLEPRPYAPQKKKNPDAEEVTVKPSSEKTTSAPTTLAAVTSTVATSVVVAPTTVTPRAVEAPKPEKIEERTGAQKDGKKTVEKKKECEDCWDRPWYYDWSHPTDFWNRQRPNYPPKPPHYQPPHYTFPHYNWNAGPVNHRYGSHWPSWRYGSHLPNDEPYYPKGAPYWPDVAPYPSKAAPYWPETAPYPAKGGPYLPKADPRLHKDAFYVSKDGTYWPKDGSYIPQFNGYAWW